MNLCSQKKSSTRQTFYYKSGVTPNFCRGYHCCLPIYRWIYGFHQLYKGHEIQSFNIVKKESSIYEFIKKSIDQDGDHKHGFFCEYLRMKSGILYGGKKMVFIRCIFFSSHSTKRNFSPFFIFNNLLKGEMTEKK